MKVAHAEDSAQINSVRGAEREFKTLLTGDDTALDNFRLYFVRQKGEVDVPRHKHNFDQIRMCLEGEGQNYGERKWIKAGELAYFPEGTPYGPERSNCERLSITLQFGGASRNGFVSSARLQRAMDEMKEFGTFEKGIFKRVGQLAPGEKRNQDAYEAIWAHVNGRPLAYPKPRYPGPIMMDSADFSWVITDAVGVAEKLLGIFTERRASARFVRLAAEATLEAAGRGIYVVCSGDGRVADEPARRFTTLSLEHGETAAFTAGQDMELLHLGLPDLRGLAAQPEAFAPAEAAE